MEELEPKFYTYLLNLAQPKTEEEKAYFAGSGVPYIEKQEKRDFYCINCDETVSGRFLNVVEPLTGESLDFKVHNSCQNVKQDKITFTVKGGNNDSEAKLFDLLVKDTNYKDILHKIAVTKQFTRNYDPTKHDETFCAMYK